MLEISEDKVSDVWVGGIEGRDELLEIGAKFGAFCSVIRVGSLDGVDVEDS